MSNKMPMMDVEQAKIQLVVPAITRAVLERLAKNAGQSMNEYANVLLARGLHDEPTTEEDLARANAIIAKNIEQRAKNKAKKGIR
jgi:hypothetical protein